MRLLYLLALAGTAMASRRTPAQLDDLIAVEDGDGTSVQVDLDPYERLVRRVSSTPPSSMTGDLWLWWELLAEDPGSPHSVQVLGEGRCLHAQEHRPEFMRRWLRRRLQEFTTPVNFFHDVLAECSSDRLYEWIAEDLPTITLRGAAVQNLTSQQAFLQQAATIWQRGHVGREELALPAWEAILEYPSDVDRCVFERAIFNFGVLRAAHRRGLSFTLRDIDANPTILTLSEHVIAHASADTRREMFVEERLGDPLLRHRPDLVFPPVNSTPGVLELPMTCNWLWLYHRAGEFPEALPVRSHISLAHFASPHPATLPEDQCQQMPWMDSSSDPHIRLVWRKLAFQALYGQHPMPTPNAEAPEAPLGEPLSVPKARPWIGCLLSAFPGGSLPFNSRLDVLLLAGLMMMVEGEVGASGSPILATLDPQDMQLLRGVADALPPVADACIVAGVDVAVVEPLAVDPLPISLLPAFVSRAPKPPPPDIVTSATVDVPKKSTEKRFTGPLWVLAIVMILLLAAVLVAGLMLRRRRAGRVSPIPAHHS